MMLDKNDEDIKIGSVVINENGDEGTVEGYVGKDLISVFSFTNTELETWDADEVELKR